MSSAHTVVNALNWVGKVALSIDVLVLSLVVVVSTAVLLRPARRFDDSPRWKTLVSCAVALFTMAAALNTLVSTRPLAKAFRTVKGGMLVSGMV